MPAAQFAERASQWLVAAIEGAIDARGSCAIALAGGDTPRPVYARLAAPELAARIRWNRLHVFFGDERGVPPTDPHSNYRTARDTLLDQVPVPATQVHRMEAERDDLAAAARAYGRVLPAALDVLILGMGSDWHTASLFPGAPAVVEQRRRVVPATSPEPPVQRLTITPPVIGAARQVILMVTGGRKASQVARALQPPFEPERMPVQLARHGTWLLDSAAAALLEPR